jgi:hypothetical protein
MDVQKNLLLDVIEPEVAALIDAGRRDVFTRFGRQALVASAPVMLAMASSEAFAAGGLPQQVVDVLNYALTLEYFEANFYKNANKAEGLIPARYRGLFREIGQHEAGHVALLNGVLGSIAVKPPKIDFTAGGKYPDVFSNFTTFSTLSSTIEDLGVAAFAGQMGNLIKTPVLQTALQIHSVEARHAASVRLIVGKSGSDEAFDKPKTKTEILEAVKPFMT